MIRTVSDLTHILEAMQRGESSAAEALLPLVYDELRRIAAYKMAQESPGHTLQPTALVHEAWLRMIGDGNENFGGRAHFFAVAAEAMRRILVENARRKKSAKSGGNHTRVALSDNEPAIEGPSVDLLALDEALGLLEAKDKRKADVIKLRFFAGLTNAQAAEALGISPATADNDWAYAKTWLRVTIRNEPDSENLPKKTSDR